MFSKILVSFVSVLSFSAFALIGPQLHTSKICEDTPENREMYEFIVDFRDSKSYKDSSFYDFMLVNYIAEVVAVDERIKRANKLARLLQNQELCYFPEYADKYCTLDLYVMNDMKLDRLKDMATVLKKLEIVRETLIKSRKCFEFKDQSKNLHWTDTYEMQTNCNDFGMKNLFDTRFLKAQLNDLDFSDIPYFSSTFLVSFENLKHNVNTFYSEIDVVSHSKWGPYHSFPDFLEALKNKLF